MALTQARGRIPPQDGFDFIYNRLLELERRVKELETKAYVSIPKYDWENPPDDPFQGQIALFINTPGS